MKERERGGLFSRGEEGEERRGSVGEVSLFSRDLA